MAIEIKEKKTIRKAFKTIERIKMGKNNNQKKQKQKQQNDK